MDSERPDPQAIVDQVIAEGAEVARAVRSYYERMVNLGFEERPALELAIAYQATLLTGKS